MADDIVGLADGPLASEGYVFSVGTAVDDALTVSEAWSYVVIPGGVAAATFKVVESFGFEFLRNASVAEQFRVVDRLRVTGLQSLVESVTTSDSFLATLNHVFGSRFTMGDLYSPTFIYNLGMVERIRLLSLLDHLNALSFADSFGLGDATAYAFVAGAQIVETLRLNVDLVNHLVLRVALNERMALDDEALLHFIFSVGIEEGIVAEIIGSPGGSITTWAINTRTNAVTEYKNFNFNSFAAMGRKYIAADSAGLYELNGARDENANIMSLLAGGFFQPNGGKYAGLKGVYLGVRGQGRGATPRWLLKLIMGDGREYVYQRASNPNLMTTKFDIGKGLKARYLAWELVNQDGQDFDLDSVEFIPMMSGRRIG